MRATATQPRSVPLLAHAWRAALAALALVGVTACGGGGGGPSAPAGPPTLDGLSGRVLMPAFDLGRIIEQEPNDVPAQPFRLPPFWPRCTLEVTGTLGSTAAHYGRSDPADVFLFSATRGQSLELELDFPATDPVGAGANDFRVEVVRRATGVSVAVTGPGLPRSLTFDAAADEAYDILVTAAAGHGWYVMRLTGEDLPSGPQPLTQAKPSPVDLRAAAPAPVRPGVCARTHVLVRFEEGCDVGAFCSREGLALGRRTGTGSYRVRLPAAEHGEAQAAALCERLARRAGVRWAEPDWIVRSLGNAGDPEFNRQWNLRAIGAPSAWDIERGRESVVVAVVDAGIADHPDLEGRTVPGYDFVSSASIAADGDGRDPDPTDPGDQEANSGLSVWHGTHVSSIIVGRTDDGYGCSGVAPDCVVMMLRALGIGGGFVSDAADAILYAAGLLVLPDGSRVTSPVRIINLSVGLDQDSAELRDACDRASNVGSFLVAAVGNGGGAVQFPARYPSTFAVSAVDGKLLTTSYSSFGAEVDIAAPGGGNSTDQWNDGWHEGVPASAIDETVDPAVPSHRYLVGTSQAAPHVAGAAALLLSLDSTLTRQDLGTILRATALDLGQPGTDVAYGAGLLQVHEAVKAVLTRRGNPRTDAPRLMLPTESVQFEGLRTSIELPLYNAGGGTLEVFLASGETDDGGTWLSGVLNPSSRPSPPVNRKSVRINVDRSRLPATGDRFSGTLHIADLSGTLGIVRVVVYRGERTRVGQILPVVAIEEDSGIARRKGFAYPEFGYRYWLRGLPAAFYRLQAGEDLDRDGFFCESIDACGWHGGPTELDAVPVEHVPNEPAVQGLSIELAAPP